MVDRQFGLIDLIDDTYAGKDVFFRAMRVAKNVMTSPVKTLTLDDTVGTCYRLMIVTVMDLIYTLLATYKVVEKREP